MPTSNEIFLLPACPVVRFLAEANYSAYYAGIILSNGSIYSIL